VVGSEPAKITEPEGSVSQKTDVNTLSVSTIETQTFTGKLQRPSVEVKNGDTLLTEGVDYALSYSKNRKVGRAVVKISGIGSYEGTRKVFFYIAPKAPSYRRLTLLENNKIYVKWRKVKNAGGYQIQLASNRKFTKNVRSIEINKNTKLSKKIKVKSKKKYVYVRICSYKVFNGIIYYGNYGKVKRVRINS
jgi:hypothetical protein